MSNRYNHKNIDKVILRAVEKVLKSKVLDIKKMGYGEVNHVYKIKTEKNTVIARVFGYSDRPANGKLQWIEKQLTKHHILHAKLLYYPRNSKYFRYGFMLSEFVDGLNGSQDYDKGIHTLSQSYKQSGKILRKIHQIKSKRYGNINYGQGQYPDYLEMELKKVKKTINVLIKHKAFPADISEKVATVIRTCLEPYKHTFHPVLIHGDASRENSIWAKGKEFILVDWDNAKFSIWMRDFIEYSFWWMHLPEWKSGSKRKIARKAFFKGYGKVEYTPKDIDVIQHGLHLVKSVEMLYYYLLEKNDVKNFRVVKKNLFKLLRK